MPILVVRLGSPRQEGEGLRLGAVRFPPRGVRKTDLARFDYYDVWLPHLAPSAGLVKQAQGAQDDRSWAAFRRQYRREMSAPETSRLLDLLAALSHQTNLSVGCYCADQARCHRSILEDLLKERGADVASVEPEAAA